MCRECFLALEPDTVSPITSWRRIHIPMLIDWNDSNPSGLVSNASNPSHGRSKGPWKRTFALSTWNIRCQIIRKDVYVHSQVMNRIEPSSAWSRVDYLRQDRVFLPSIRRSSKSSLSSPPRWMDENVPFFLANRILVRLLHGLEIETRMGSIVGYNHVFFFSFGRRSISYLSKDSFRFHEKRYDVRTLMCQKQEIGDAWSHVEVKKGRCYSFSRLRKRRKDSFDQKERHRLSIRLRKDGFRNVSSHSWSITIQVQRNLDKRWDGSVNFFHSIGWSSKGSQFTSSWRGVKRVGKKRNMDVDLLQPIS